MLRSVSDILKGRAAGPLGRSITAAVILAKVTTWSKGRFVATRYRAGRLAIKAPTPIEAQELVLQREQVRAQLNDYLGQPLIKSISIHS